MESRMINCPKCRKQYKVYLEAHTYFKCYNCDGIIDHNSTPLQRANSFTATTQSLSTPVHTTTHRQSQSTPFDIGKFGIYCFVGTFGVLCLVALFAALGSIGSIVNRTQPVATSMQESSQSVEHQPALPSPGNNGTYKNAVSQSTIASASCIIVQSTVTYDANFEPSADLVLKNQSDKVITQVMVMFDFSDMSGWANTSVSRSLAQASITYSNITIGILPGQTAEGNLKIPLPQAKGKDKPNISVVKVRFEDGSIGN